MKVYEVHKFNTNWDDLRGVDWYLNPHKAMDVLTKEADCYVEWKQMSEYHYVGLKSTDSRDDFYIVYIRNVIE